MQGKRQIEPADDPSQDDDQQELNEEESNSKSKLTPPYSC